MIPERWQRVCELFDAACERNRSAADAFLVAECGGDQELLSEVRNMLVERERTGVLDHPAWDAIPEPAAPAPVFSPGQLVAGRYRIVRYLSRGGMGEVYQAEHPLLPDRVALKTLLPGIANDQAMIARFKQEIHLARKISHPNVCKVYDLEWHEAESPSKDRILFLTMEFLEGETLSSHLRRNGPMTAPEALPLLEQMSDALDAAHRCGIVHRDFKSSNVMLAPTGEGGVRAVVTDFGLARSVSASDGSTVSITKHIPGTLDYMAPELLKGSLATFRSDIYALGVVAYQMVTGSLPFAGEAPMAAALLRSQKPVPSPRNLAPELDAKWERAILRALERDPGLRFSQARELPKALRGEAVSAPVRVPNMRRRKLLAAACLTAALVAGGMGWRNWSRARGRLNPEAARLYQQGVDDIHAGAYFAATKALEQAVKHAPAFSPARARLSESWFELDLPEKAAIEFLPIRRQDNSWLPKLDQLQIDAVEYTITREFDAAVKKYEQMRKLANPGSADLDVDLGRAYEKGRKQDLAVAAYRRAAEGPSHSAAAWLRLGVLYERTELTDSEAAFAEAERRYQMMSSMEGITELTLQRGVAANRNQKYGEAAALLRKAMEHAHEAGNLQQEISAKLTLANVSYKAGESDVAERLAREALATAQANQMESLTIRGFINLGSAYQSKGDLAGAEQHFRDALALAERNNSSRFVALSQLSLAGLHDLQLRSEDQIREAKEALKYFQPNRWVQETFSGLLLLGRAEQYRGNFTAAQESFEHLLDESSKAQDRANMAIAQEALGNVLSAQEKYPQALVHYLAYLGLSTDPFHSGYAALDCAIMFVILGQSSEAAGQFAHAEQAAVHYSVLRPLLAGGRAEMALSRNEWREAIRGTRSALAGIGNLNPRDEADLTRLLGLALLRSGDREAGLQKCEEAHAFAQKLNDSGELHSTRMALLEALLATRDSVRALTVFHEMESNLGAHPESRWLALAFAARADRQYADRAREAIGQLETLWGHNAFLQYMTRPDLQELSRPLMRTISAKH